MKVIKTIILTCAIIFTFILWGTRIEDLPSQSAYALSENNIWYILMHCSIIASFLLDWFTHKKRWLNFLPAIGSFFILYWDMYNSSALHNWATGFTMATAVLSLLVYAPTARERVYIAVNCIVGAFMFPLGLFTEVPLFFTEIIAEFCIGIGLARRFWVEEYES